MNKCQENSDSSHTTIRKYDIHEFNYRLIDYVRMG
ncbi:uncharacterized protein METZ01_LOCUS272444 [marine metagenome]|uniref:Uncharacterized protein n=1 Tax=marine metagenome TaxID=408172 RepID=A0A382K559_9ZZZZ